MNPKSDTFDACVWGRCGHTLDECPFEQEES